MSAKAQKEAGRLEGIAYAVNFLNTHNNDIEALKEDAKRRGIDCNHILLPYDTQSELTKKVTKDVIPKLMHYFIILSCITLHDEFDFEGDELRQFADRFNEKAACIDEDYTTWEETEAILKEECGFDYDIVNEASDK